jgi:hypothetical protein
MYSMTQKNDIPYVGQHTEAAHKISSIALQCGVLTKMLDVQVATLWNNDQA